MGRPASRGLSPVLPSTSSPLVVPLLVIRDALFAFRLHLPLAPHPPYLTHGLRQDALYFTGYPSRGCHGDSKVSQDRLEAWRSHSEAAHLAVPHRDLGISTPCPSNISSPPQSFLPLPNGFPPRHPFGQLVAPVGPSLQVAFSCARRCPARPPRALECK